MAGLEKRKEYCQLLGVDEAASKEEIKKAYKQLALRWHPDKNMHDPEATQEFQKISEAYTNLCQGEDDVEENGNNIYEDSFLFDILQLYFAMKRRSHIFMSNLSPRYNGYAENGDGISRHDYKGKFSGQPSSVFDNLHSNEDWSEEVNISTSASELNSEGKSKKKKKNRKGSAAPQNTKDAVPLDHTADTVNDKTKKQMNSNKSVQETTIKIKLQSQVGTDSNCTVNSTVNHVGEAQPSDLDYEFKNSEGNQRRRGSKDSSVAAKVSSQNSTAQAPDKKPTKKKLQAEQRKRDKQCEEIRKEIVQKNQIEEEKRKKKEEKEKAKQDAFLNNDQFVKQQDEVVVDDVREKSVSEIKTGFHETCKDEHLGTTEQIQPQRSLSEFHSCEHTLIGSEQQKECMRASNQNEVHSTETDISTESRTVHGQSVGCSNRDDFSRHSNPRQTFTRIFYGHSSSNRDRSNRSDYDTDDATDRRRSHPPRYYPSSRDDRDELSDNGFRCRSEVKDGSVNRGPQGFSNDPDHRNRWGGTQSGKTNLRGNSERTNRGRYGRGGPRHSRNQDLPNESNTKVFQHSSVNLERFGHTSAPDSGTSKFDDLDNIPDARTSRDQMTLNSSQEFLERKNEVDERNRSCPTTEIESLGSSVTGGSHACDTGFQNSSKQKWRNQNDHGGGGSYKHCVLNSFQSNKSEKFWDKSEQESNKLHAGSIRSSSSSTTQACEILENNDVSYDRSRPNRGRYRGQGQRARGRAFANRDTIGHKTEPQDPVKKNFEQNNCEAKYTPRYDYHGGSLLFHRRSSLYRETHGTASSDNNSISMCNQKPSDLNKCQNQVAAPTAVGIGSRPDVVPAVQNVWRERQEFYQGALPKTMEEEEAMLVTALRLSELDVNEKQLKGSDEVSTSLRYDMHASHYESSSGPNWIFDSSKHMSDTEEEFVTLSQTEFHRSSALQENSCGGGSEILLPTRRHRSMASNEDEKVETQPPANYALSVDLPKTKSWADQVEEDVNNRLTMTHCSRLTHQSVVLTESTVPTVELKVSHSFPTDATLDSSEVQRFRDSSTVEKVPNNLAGSEEHNIIFRSCHTSSCEFDLDALPSQESVTSIVDSGVHHTEMLINPSSFAQSSSVLPPGEIVVTLADSSVVYSNEPNVEIGQAELLNCSSMLDDVDDEAVVESIRTREEYPCDSIIANDDSRFDKNSSDLVANEQPVNSELSDHCPSVLHFPMSLNVAPGWIQAPYPPQFLYPPGYPWYTYPYPHFLPFIPSGANPSAGITPIASQTPQAQMMPCVELSSSEDHSTNGTLQPTPLMPTGYPALPQTLPPMPAMLPNPIPFSFTPHPGLMMPYPAMHYPAYMPIAVASEETREGVQTGDTNVISSAEEGK